MHKSRAPIHSGIALPMIIIIVAALAILAGVAVPKFMNVTKEAERGSEAPKQEEGSTAREAAPAVSALAACQAKCRNDYGGSGSSGFDACMRSCGEGGALREQACASPGPACPSPQSPVCHDGKWYCRENAPASSGARVFPETNNFDVNYPTEAQLREGACGEPALACPSPEIPSCSNGQWICIGPAKGVN